MPLQFLQTLKNATAVCKLWKTPLQTSKNATRNGMKWHFSKFGNCSGIFMNRHNWSGIYLIFFETEAGYQLGCAGHSGLSRQHFLLCLPQTSPVVLFSFWKWLAQLFCDLSSKSFYQACWAANLSRRGELHSAGRENGVSVMRNGLYIFKTHQTGN